MCFQVLQGVLLWVIWGSSLQLVWLFCWVAPWRSHESGQALQSSLMDVSTGAFPRNHSNGRPGVFPWDCLSAHLELAECPGSEMYKFSEPRASLPICLSEHPCTVIKNPQNKYGLQNEQEAQASGLHHRHTAFKYVRSKLSSGGAHL